MSLFFGGSASALLPETAWFNRREEEDIYLRPDAPRLANAKEWLEPKAPTEHVPRL